MAMGPLSSGSLLAETVSGASIALAVLYLFPDIVSDHYMEIYRGFFDTWATSMYNKGVTYEVPWEMALPFSDFSASSKSPERVLDV